MSRTRTPNDDLRLVIDCLPVHTREAMLTGIRTNRIIVGAYSDGDGGVCPMLAAHRNGGRINLASFARSWDRYTDADHPRPATERELRTLVALLESSLVDELPPPARADRPQAQRPRLPFRIRRVRKPRDAEAPKPISVA